MPKQTESIACALFLNKVMMHRVQAALPFLLTASNNTADIMLCCSVSSIKEIAVSDVLPMGTWADHLHMRAFVTALPVHLKLLDVAGSRTHIQIFEPGDFNGEGSAFGSTAAAAAAAADPLQVWLIFEPMHYEVLYPAEAYKSLERLSDALE